MKKELGRDQLFLSDVLPEKRMKLDAKVSSWQEAVREVGALLETTGAVTDKYSDAMIRVAEELGPYIVIAPGVALPHAATKDGALKTAMSLVRLAEPINFGNPDHDPVRLVIGLAALDKKAHMLALKTLAKILMDKELLDRLHKAETTEEISKVLRKAEMNMTEQDYE